MRVLFVSNLFPPDIGGPATHISRLAAELHERGHAVRAVVCTDGDTGPGPEPYPVKRVSRRLPVPLRFAHVFAWVWRWALRSDIVYVNGLELPAVFGGAAAFKPRILKVVGDFAWEYATRQLWTSDTIDEFQTRRYAIKVELVRLAQMLYCKFATRVVVPSLYLQGLVGGWGVPPRKVVVINNALTSSPEIRIGPDKLRRSVGVDGPMVLTVARLYSWKKIDDLIRMSLSFGPDATLVIAGDGPERGFLESLARTEGARAKFIGAVPQADVYSYLAAADVFVLNTSYEGMSHVLLEARWAGAKIVTTAVGGNLEILEDRINALLVDYGDHEAMIEAVRALLSDRSLGCRLSDAARQGLAQYRWDRLVEETVSLCKATAGIA
ncbi:MAG: glycosyltransferase family 4 protein [Chloroflexi bacterium]|nr:glycosyltransferase family 4 protein [Chloroflexota bacterium]MCY3938079.1 glycosyltransferase family 4 protein [Chloroflexota bacterium]